MGSILSAIRNKQLPPILGTLQLVKVESQEIIKEVAINLTAKNVKS